MTNENTIDTMVTDDVAVQEVVAVANDFEINAFGAASALDKDEEVSFQTEAEVGGEPVAVTIH